MSKTEYTSCEGLKFVVTGKLKVFANREELIDYIESEGGVVGSSVTSKTNYLINNDFESQSGKNKKAKELNIQIITEKQFLDMFGENYIEKDEDEPSNMISVKCPDADKKDLADLLMCAYTEMILNGMGIGNEEIETGPNPWNVEYVPLSHESKRFTEARHAIVEKDLCKTEKQKDKVILQTLSADDTAFVLADVLMGENSYSDNFGQDDSSLLHIAEMIRKTYPEAIIEGDMEFQGPGYYYIEYIRTKNGKIQVWNSEDPEVRTVDDCKRDMPPILKKISEMGKAQLYSVIRLYGVDPETENIKDNPVANTWEELLDFFVKQDIDEMYASLCNSNSTEWKSGARTMTREELLKFFDSSEESILDFSEFFDRSIEYGLKYLERLKGLSVRKSSYVYSGSGKSL
ncbi:BRCT domain-containing protein [Anaerolactibacter massiliensis]|uniref:BRCT domain-containing protein n=1 Tax=Anaerolactibacter massiliensis TaxID=2044573 RepID=UPI001957D39F|nr:BRCT domain-containing protein [Anaerolactibacter massiliensis]